MAIKNKEELLGAIRGLVNDDTSDEALALFDDVSDTLDSLNDEENKKYKQMYEENDKKWREKYRDRFMSGSPAGNEPDDDAEDKPKKLTFESLFKEG